MNLFESLEARRLFAVAYRVNFQPAESTETAPGYRTDLGREFGTRGNGLRYGWNRDVSDQTFDRNAAGVDQLYESGVRLESGDAWEIEVPDGWYSVVLSSGDPAVTEGDFRVSVEGVPTLRGKLGFGERYIEGEGVVRVNDGRLTLTPGDNAESNVLNFVQIRSTDAPPNYASTDDLNWRTESDQLAFGRIEAGAITFGKFRYVLGGYTDGYAAAWGRVDRLNLETGKWNRSTSLPGAQTHFGLATDGKYIYVAGGQYGNEQGPATGEVWRYNPANNRWNRSIDLPARRLGGQLTYYDNALHFFGGDGPNRTKPTTTHWVLRYDEIDKGWQDAAPMPEALDHFGITQVGNTTLVFGGERGHGTSYVQSNNVYAINLTRDTWTEKAPMPTASSHFESAIVQHDGKVYLAAGQGPSYSTLNEVRVYDPRRDTWTLDTAMPLDRKAGYTWVYDGRWFYASGEKDGSTADRMVYSTLLS